VYLRGSPLRRSCTHLATEAKSPRLSQRRSLPARSGAGKGDAQQTDQGGGAAEIITGGVGLAAWRTNATTTISPFPTWSGSGNTKYLAASVRGNFAPNVPIASSVVLRLRDRVPLKGMGKLAALRRRRGGRGWVEDGEREASPHPCADNPTVMFHPVAAAHYGTHHNDTKTHLAEPHTATDRGLPTSPIPFT